MPSPIGKVCAVRFVAATVLNACPVLVATIIEPVLPVPKLLPEVVDVDVRLKAPKLILPAVSVKPVAFETVALLPKVNIAALLFIVIPEKARGVVVATNEPVIAPEPPITKGVEAAVKVPLPKVIIPLSVSVLVLIAKAPLDKLNVPPTVKVVPETTACPVLLIVKLFKVPPPVVPNIPLAPMVPPGVEPTIKFEVDVPTNLFAVVVVIGPFAVKV